MYGYYEASALCMRGWIFFFEVYLCIGQINTVSLNGQPKKSCSTPLTDKFLLSLLVSFNLWQSLII